MLQIKRTDDEDKVITNNQLFDFIVYAKWIMVFAVVQVVIILVGWGSVAQEATNSSRFRDIQRAINLYNVEILESHESEILSQKKKIELLESIVKKNKLIK